MESLGIPTVTIVTSSFKSLAKVVVSAEHIEDACFVVVPHPVGMLPQADVLKKAEDAFPEIVKMASEWQPLGKSPTSIKTAYPAERFDFTGTIREVDKLYFEKGWSLGLPIIPPTPECVEEILAGTKRKPGEVLGQVPPRMGTLTIELVATIAAMAGCKPEYMPLLVAISEALLNPSANWRGALATTGTAQTVVIVNGPIIKEIGIAYGQGAAGKGYHTNASIGYAVNLIAYTVGGSKPPLVDMSTLASPADFVCWVFGENEEKLPRGWEPLHVERGFKESDSVVTVMSSYPPVENADSGSITPDEHVRWWGNLISPLIGIGGPCIPITIEQSPILAIGPEHAELISSTGWTKDDFRQVLWEKSRILLSVWPAGCSQMENLIDKLGPIRSESLIPITLKPESFLIVLAGGIGKHSHYFAPFVGSFPVSKVITE
ncbi:UGSC family (seleno)protein [Chloroflexota bacterium]